MTGFESTSIVIAVISALTNLGALLFVGLQVKQGAANTASAAKAALAEADLRHREWGLRYYLESMQQRDISRASLPPVRDQQGIAQFIKDAATDPAKDYAIRQLLSYQDLLATGVNMGTLDTQIVYRFDSNAIQAVWQNYRPWIEAERTRRGDPTIYHELQQLAHTLSTMPKPMPFEAASAPTPS